LVTADDVDAAPDPDVLAADEEPPADDESLLLPPLLLLPQAATAPHRAMTAAIIPTRVRILHSPFSIDLLLRTALTSPAIGRQPKPQRSGDVTLGRCVTRRVYERGPAPNMSERGENRLAD
jgi:hypothetical protein